MHGITRSAARIAAAVAVILIVYVKLFEHRFLYYPQAQLAATPSVAYEDVRFDASDGTRLHGWLVPAGGDRILIVSHGNGGNIGHRASMIEFLRNTFQTNVFIYDYRGYGQSEGRPSEEGTYSDIRGAYAFARRRGFAPEDIYLLGQSLGTAVAVDLAAEQTVGGVILEAPFASVPAMARHMLGIPLGWLLRTRYDSVAKIPRVDAPVAIVHAREDPIVPFEQGEALFEAGAEPKRLFPVEGSVHEGVTIALGLERQRELQEFVFGAR